MSADPGRNRDDVSERTTEFNPNNVIVGINAKGSVTELALHGRRDIWIFRGNGDGGRIAARHFGCETGPTESADAEILGPSFRGDFDHFGHA